MAVPVRINELLKITDLGINPANIAFSTLTLESEKFVCVREAAEGQNSVAIIDVANRNLVRQNLNPAQKVDSALMNPSSKVIALRAGNNLQVINLDMKSKMKTHNLPPTEAVVYWRWINVNTIAIVTGSAVYHWSMEGTAEPKKIFDRHPSMATANIINYRVDSTGLWCILIGLARQDDGSTKGVMQLYSVERNQTQPVEGHAATFVDYVYPGTSTKTSVLCVAANTAAGGKLFVMEVPQKSTEDAQKAAAAAGTAVPSFQKRAVAITFSSPQDFPVAMQASEKHGIVYLVTRSGLLYLFELETASLLYTSRMSAETVFVAAPNEPVNGFVAVNKTGSLISVSVEDSQIVPYIQTSLGNLDLAIKIAARANLSGGDELFVQQFNKLLMEMNIAEAVKLAASSPNGILRTPATIQRLQHLPVLPGQQPPLSIYFKYLLEKGKLNNYESLELAKVVLQRAGGAGYLKGLWEKSQLEASEELGDLLRASDADLALALYKSAKAASKVVGMLLERADYAGAIAFARSTGFTPDYLALLNNLIAYNPDGAASFAIALVNAEGGPLADPNQMVDLFVARSFIQQATAFLFDILKNNRPEEAALQTRLLEINLMYSPPAIADQILGSEMVTHYDRQRIALLCEKAQLYQRALENYTDMNDIKRVIPYCVMFPDFLVSYFSNLSEDESIELMKVLLNANLRNNIQLVVKIATQYSEALNPDKVMALFESVKSFEGLYYYLASIVNVRTEPDVHFKYIEAATRLGQYQEVERVTRESNYYDPVRVKDFLKEVRLPDQWPLINVCDRYDFVPELVNFLYTNNQLKFVEAFVQKRNPLRTPLVVGALLDVDCSEDYIKNLVMSVGALCPVEPLVEECEKRNRLKLILPWLEARITEGNSEVVTHNAIAKIYIDVNNSPAQFLQTNQYYDSLLIGKYCEKRDPQLAYIAYKRGQCDMELVAVTSKNGMFKQQARYLVERQNLELWAAVLSDDNASRRQLIDQVVQTALPDSKNPEEVSTTVKAFMTADLPNELIELLEKIVLQGNSEFKKNKNLQNLLILTAIKADKSRVMDYINRLDNYDAPDIANIAVGSDLFEEAFVIYSKFKLQKNAINVLLDNLHNLQRAAEFADKVNDAEVWSLLATAQLHSDLVPAAIESFLKANDPSIYHEVVAAAQRMGNYAELVKYLQMARKKLKDSFIDTELVYCLAKVNRLADLEDFINGPNSAQIQQAGDRTFDEELFEAAKILYGNINNFPRLASSLIRLGQYHAAVDAARKASSIRTWKEVNAACIDAREFRLAQMCGIQIIVHADELEEMINNYEIRGYHDELISLLENGLSSDRAHMGMFTELGILYAKYRSEKLMEHITLFWKRINIPKLLRVCETSNLWAEARFLYINYDEFDNAARVMMEHPVEAWDHAIFKETIVKVGNLELFYKALYFYLEEHPKMINDLLNALVSRIDHTRVVNEMRRAGHIALIKPYLESIQSNNITAVNEALNELYIDEENVEELRKSIDEFDAFDQISLAQKLEKLELLEFRRVSSYLYKRNKRWSQSVELSKRDGLYKDAMETTAESADAELAEELLRFFVAENLPEAFAASLFTCYELVKPDVALELAWRNKIIDFAFPYMIQVVREYTGKVDELVRKDQEAQAAIMRPEEVAAAEAAAAAAVAPVVDQYGMAAASYGMAPVADMSAYGMAPVTPVADMSAYGIAPTGYAMPGYPQSGMY